MLHDVMSALVLANEFNLSDINLKCILVVVGKVGLAAMLYVIIGDARKLDFSSVYCGSNRFDVL